MAVAVLEGVGETDDVGGERMDADHANHRGAEIQG